MRLFKILKTFPGSQDGSITETFEKGEERELSDYLASAADPTCIEEIKPAASSKTAASANKKTTQDKKK